MDRYLLFKINEFGSIVLVVGILLNILVCFLLDLFWGLVWVIIFVFVMNVIGFIILVVWKVFEFVMWFVFVGMYWLLLFLSVLYGWVNMIF